MDRSQQSGKTLPAPVPIVGTAVVVLHLGAIAVLALAAQSGPWPTPFGSSTALPPMFAAKLNELATPYYLEPLRMTHNYHFPTNRPERPGAKFDVVVKDANGKTLKKLPFPDPNANGWVQFRQRLLALGLADDEPVQLPRGEVIPAPGKKMETVSFWDAPPGETTMKLRTAPVHLAPKERQLYRPRPWSQLLARAYLRHVGRHESEGATLELVRRTREPVMPAMMFFDEPPPGSFNEFVCHFGEQKRDR